VAICDESGLLDVNQLTNKAGRPDRQRIDQFLRLIDLLNRQEPDADRIGYGIVPAIIDWVDSDDEVTHLDFIQNENVGAEAGHYQTRRSPCACRNRPIGTVDELLPVKGMSAERLARLRPYLTCAGDGKININTAPKLILESLSPRIDGALAQMIVEKRSRNPFKNAAELRKVPGMTDETYKSIQARITVSPQQRRYRVTSTGYAAARQCAIEAVLLRNADVQEIDIVHYREFAP
jgi:general secretion pathway protein K